MRTRCVYVETWLPGDLNQVWIRSGANPELALSLAAHGHEVGDERSRGGELLAERLHGGLRDGCFLLHHHDRQSETMRGGGQRAHIEERVGREHQHVEDPLQVEPLQVSCEPGGVAAARLRAGEVVCGDAAPDSFAQDTQGAATPKRLVWKAPHFELWVSLERAEILVEKVIEGKDAKFLHQRGLAGSRNPNRADRSSRVVPKRATATTYTTMAGTQQRAISIKPLWREEVRGQVR